MNDCVDRFKSVTEAMVALYEKKNHDYGNSFDQTMDEFGIVSAVIRMNDKIKRIKSIISNGSIKVNDEKIEDTITDLCCYGIMTLMWIKKQKGHEI